jgi:hypothetical protein
MNRGSRYAVSWITPCTARRARPGREVEIAFNDDAQRAARQATARWVAAPVALGGAALLWWLGAPASVEASREAVVVSVAGRF